MSGRPFHDSPGQIRLPDRLVELRGADVRSWLQGQVTNSVLELPPKGVGACFVSATGQIETVVRIYPLEDRVGIVTEHPDIVLARVHRFVVLEDVEASLSPLVCTTIQGTEEMEVVIESPSFALPHDRTGHGGFDVFHPSDEPVLLAPFATQEEYLLGTLEAGRPEADVDYGAKTLPPELGKAFESAHVSYTKGCYLGQEVLHRLYSRGHTNKTWVGLRCHAPVQPGAKVTFEDQEVGTVTRSGVSAEYGPIAAATLRNIATAEGTSVHVGGVEATVVRLPFRLADAL